MQRFGWVIALGLAGCTGGTGEGLDSVTVHTMGSEAEGFVLSHRKVIEISSRDHGCPECFEAEAGVDFAIYLGHAASMGLPDFNEPQPFCFKGDFDSLEDIPSDISDCDWGRASLGYGHAELKSGYIVRDRHQRRYWRLRLLEMSYEERYEAVFEVGGL